MEGRKVVFTLFALTAVVVVITLTLYFLVRQDEDEDDGAQTPNAIVAKHEALSPASLLT